MLGSLETAPVAWDVLPREREQSGGVEKNREGNGAIVRVKSKRSAEGKKSQEI